MTTKPPLRWHGGKQYLARRIVSLMPAHTRYVEPFAGGLSVLLAKDPEGVAEFAGDLNNQLVNFWQVLGDESAFRSFSLAVGCMPLSERVFEHAAKAVNGSYRELNLLNKPEGFRVTAAAHFFVAVRQSRQGLAKDYCTPTKRLRRGMNEQVSAWLSAVDGLPEVAERLRRVELWCRPAVEMIRKLDLPETLFYLDPPYLPSERVTTGEYREQEMSTEDHQELLESLTNLQGKFILSGYPSDLYDSFSARCGWHTVDFDLPNNASARKSKERKTERLWMNYEPHTTEPSDCIAVCQDEATGS